ncbi:MAG: quinolinate synthase [Nitrospirae bacterium]|nr:quinolinate synthase [Nitrospirota bacterium]
MGSDEFNEIAAKIAQLKKDKNAVILAHNYQRDEVQFIADLTGDSLELSRAAAETNYDVIIFAGVHFMAESASILSPDKTVVLTESEAGCPMADMVTVEGARFYGTHFPGAGREFCYTYPEDFSLRDIKAKYPGVPVVSYVNTTAAVKAESDVCCTSANVVKVVNSLDSKRVICVPDKNLAAWAAKHTDKEIISWDGFCNVHDRVSAEDVIQAREAHPGALVVAHPECPMDVLELSDHVTSTSGMLRFCKSSDAKEFIIGTELGLMYRLKKDNPDKLFHALNPTMLCPNMKKTTIKSVLRALENLDCVIKVPEEIRVPAKRALDRMLEIG